MNSRYRVPRAWCVMVLAFGPLLGPAVCAVEVGTGDPPSTWLAGAKPAERASTKVQLLQFWASWCHSCAALTTDLDELRGDLPGVEHLAISTDETAADAEAAAQRLSGYAQGRAVILYDRQHVWADRFAVVTVPTVVLLDQNGRELARYSGHLNGTDLMALSAVLERAASAKKDEDHG